MINDESPQIYPNSINRVIIIDKVEYFLSFQHDRLSGFSGDSDIDLGRLSLITKIGNKDSGIFYQHKCEQSKKF
jgi:hypothetical protein